VWPPPVSSKRRNVSRPLTASTVRSSRKYGVRRTSTGSAGKAGPAERPGASDVCTRVPQEVMRPAATRITETRLIFRPIYVRISASRSITHFSPAAAQPAATRWLNRSSSEHPTPVRAADSFIRSLGFRRVPPRSTVAALAMPAEAAAPRSPTQARLLIFRRAGVLLL
jgi:hypothetical protein